MLIKDFNKLISSAMRPVAGLLATTTAITLCFNAATELLLGMVGALAALFYTIADSIDFYGIMKH